MKRIRFDKAFFVIMMSGFFVAVFSVTNVNAAKCKDISESENDSLHHACTSSGVRGAMWISSSNKTKSVSSKVKIDDWEKGDGKEKVYLHGAIIGGGSANATHIRLIKGTTELKYTYGNHGNYGPLDGIPGSMGRTGNSRTSTIKSSVKTIKLDVNKLRNAEKPKSETKTHEIYKVPIQAFRCFEGRPYGSDGCYSDKSTMTVEVSKPKYTLTANAKDFDSRAYLKKKIDSDTGYEGSNLSVNRTKYSTPTGYTWHKWGTGGKCKDAGTNNKCTVKNVKKDHDVNAYYLRNSFQGRAYAKGNGTNVVADTGFVSATTTKSGKMDCPNEGCNVSYELYLKTVKGSGKTNFWSNIRDLRPASPHAPSTSGTKYKSGTATIKPGQNYCPYIRFLPYGSYSNNTQNTATACIEAKPTTFEGKSSVTGATSGISTTNWQKSNKSETAYVDKCSPVTGCKVRFNHRMRASGIGSTNYKVSRKSNLTDTKSGKAIADNPNLKSGTFRGADAEVYKSEELTLYPGMMVCETLTFKPSNDVTKNVSDVSTNICVSALGNAQPDDPPSDTPEDPTKPSGDSSFLNIKVRNKNVSMWNKYQREVYAKPTDELAYRSVYNPALQYTYYIKPLQISIDGGTIYNSDRNSTLTLATLFNKHKSPYWNNGFGIIGSQFIPLSYAKNHVYTKGDSSKQTPPPNTHVTSRTEVGRDLNEEAKTNPDPNPNPNVKTTPRQVNFTRTNLGNVSTTDAKKHIAHAYVPYNFKNSTEVLDDQDNPYAGEDFYVKFRIDTHQKENSVTDGTYATIVREAKQRLFVCIDGVGCDYTEEEPTNANNAQGILNSDYKMEGVTDGSQTGSIRINIPDVSAGTNICIRSEVYPKTSGSDTNWNDPAGDHLWAKKLEGGGYVDAFKCFKIAKRPSLQVWGGNIYTGEKIKTGVSKKGHLAGYNNYDKKMNYKPKYIFGSWGELGTIANATVTGFGSGASTGYSSNNGGTLSPGYAFDTGYRGYGNNDGTRVPPGGSTEEDYCKRVPLSFANFPCDIDTTNAIGSAIAIRKAANDKTAVINRLISTEADYSKLNYNKVDTIGDNGELAISDTNGSINIYYNDGDIKIKSDITYGGNYTKLSQLPKVVIYAKNVIIDCSVSRIDALIIADDKVVTCDNLENTADKAGAKSHINDSQNSNQLKINGAVIANELIANRTFGAATGANSIIPAEIINFDPSLYSWGGVKDDDNNDENNSKKNQNNKKLDTVYMRELAPRR